MNSSTLRQRHHRDRLKEQGLKPREIWLDDASKSKLDALSSRYEGNKLVRYSKAIAAALNNQANHSGASTPLEYEQPRVQTQGGVTIYRIKKRLVKSGPGGVS